jgi:hypothetical protein
LERSSGIDYGVDIMIRQEVRIEFIGGPFDGHSQAVHALPASYRSTLALPVNENVFRMLEGRETGPARLSPTVALYELDDDLHIDGERQYRYLGTRPAAEFGLQGWKV